MGCCTSGPDFSVLLPETKKTFKYVNLGELHTKQYPRLDTSTLEAQMTLYAIAQGPDTNTATYGGYLEDRTELWKVYYPPLAGKITWHLAIDINNLPVYDPVCSLTDGIVVDVYNDVAEAKFNGWGGRVIVQDQHENRFVLYGHLDGVCVSVNQNVKRGETLGFVGAPDDNGHWPPHVHLQCMTRAFIKNRYNGKFPMIDGYLQEANTDILSRELIDPLTLL